MPDSEWSAIAELRAANVKHERELGGLSQVVADTKTDVDAIGSELRQTRHDMRNAMSAMEGRLIKEIKSECNSIREEQRTRRADSLTRLRFYLMLGAPLAGVFISYLLGRAGGG